MNRVNIKAISPPMIIGEGPHWLERDKSLLYIDILGKSLYRHYTESGRQQKLIIGESGAVNTPGFIVPVGGRDEEFIVGIGRTLKSVKWSPNDPDVMTSEQVKSLVDVDVHTTLTRFNDGKCDPEGRLWAGTMYYDPTTDKIENNKGTLYRFNTTFQMSEWAEKVGISNGLAWNNSRNTFYYNDSLAYSVDVFDYDQETGDVANRRTAFDFKSEGIEGLPDGMTIDINGNLWVACFQGSQIICVDPAVGKVIQKLALPSECTTSCCWGGADYSTLYVTSATKGISEGLRLSPEAGKTFEVTGLGVKGLPPNEFKVNHKILDQLKFIN